VNISQIAKEFTHSPRAPRARRAELAAAMPSLHRAWIPAAPCGASIKLAKAVSEVRRQSTGDMSFYERNNSADANSPPRAAFFVLEPALRRRPIDMDAIRNHEPKPSPTQVAERTAVATNLSAGSSPAAKAFSNDEHQRLDARVTFRRPARAA
jgi:hypothetical protein